METEWLLKPLSVGPRGVLAYTGFAWQRARKISSKQKPRFRFTGLSIVRPKPSMTFCHMHDDGDVATASIVTRCSAITFRSRGGLVNKKLCTAS